MKRNVKTVLAVILAAIMVFSAFIPAFAAESVTARRAESIALADKNYSRSQVTMKKTVAGHDKNGRSVYNVSFFVLSDDSRIEYRYKIDASSGAILEYRRDSDPIIPDSVKSLKAKKIQAKSAKLSWTPVENADGYTVYRYSSESGYGRIKNTKKPSFGLKNLKPGKTYRYCVRAYISGEKGLRYSRDYAFTSFVTLAATVKDVKAVSKKPGKITVTFPKAKGAAAYTVQCSSSPSFTSGRSVTVKDRSVTFKSLKKGAVIYVRVFSVNSAQAAGAASTTVKVKVKSK